MEENETPEEARLSEVKEETGLDVEIIEDKSKDKIKTERSFES